MEISEIMLRHLPWLIGTISGCIVGAVWKKFKKKPVRHAKRVLKTDDPWIKQYHCSNCNAIVTAGHAYRHKPESEYKYCYHCGAKMDGGKENGKL